MSIYNLSHISFISKSNTKENVPSKNKNEGNSFFTRRNDDHGPKYKLKTTFRYCVS